MTINESNREASGAYNSLLLVGLAVLAGQVGTNLCADTNTISDLDILDG